jgi:hypothetical protein
MLQRTHVASQDIVFTTEGGMSHGELRGQVEVYRPDPGSLAAGLTPPTFVRWSPPGVVTIDEGGTTGKLEYVAAYQARPQDPSHGWKPWKVVRLRSNEAARG